MNNDKIFDDITNKISDLFPGDLSQLQGDFESNIKAALQSGLTKMNLVTREEFDTQAALLVRTREKLDHLEQQLSEYIEDQKD